MYLDHFRCCWLLFARFIGFCGRHFRHSESTSPFNQERAAGWDCYLCAHFIGTFSLVYLLFSDNFSVAYVVTHSNRDLSTFYKIASLWSGQEGSLLFWSFLLSIYVISVLIAYRNKNGELMPYVGVILAGVQIFFLTLNNFVESPFKALGGVAGERNV